MFVDEGFVCINFFLLFFFFCLELRSCDKSFEGQRGLKRKKKHLPN